MSANSLGRATFVLFGIYLIVEFSVRMGSALSFAPFLNSDFSARLLLDVAVLALGSQLAFSGLFTLVPGVVLLYNSTRWADRLLPPSESPGVEIEFKALLAIGLSVLGFYFTVSGLGGLAGAAVSIALADEYTRQFGWPQLATSSISLFAGVVLVLSARRAALSNMGMKTDAE